MDKFTLAFHESVDKNLLHMTYSIVKGLGCKNIYLAGGSIYRNIIATFYGVKSSQIDFDFLVEEVPKTIDVLGWIMKMNRFGHPKLMRDDLSIDIAPLHTVPSIARRKVAPTIENYLTGVPLKVQSLVYSFEEDIVIGEIGKQAILDKRIEINDIIEAENAALKKGLTLNQMIEEKARSTQFLPIYPIKKN
ncbi:hypothetical protein JW756_05510 [Candidatus Woesearchaeota archaeon]|nr:hypothetical protein [Candidatus Woesearchaeota archaeon]